jgi:hypothetical protein
LKLDELDQLTLEDLELAVIDEAFSLSEEDFKTLEESINGGLDQLFDVLVVNFYLMSNDDSGDPDRRLKYILWIIENFGDKEFYNYAPLFYVCFMDREKAYDQIMMRWRSKTKNSTNPRVFMNAAFQTKDLSEREHFCSEALKFSSNSADVVGQIESLREVVKVLKV